MSVSQGVDTLKTISSAVLCPTREAAKINPVVTEGKLFDHQQTVKFSFSHVLIIMAAVAVSIPYWKYMGLIS